MPHKFSELADYGYKKIIGVDEVGRGAIAGPVVVGAVEIDLFIDGVKDSKKLSASKRGDLSRLILPGARQKSVGIVSAKIIDEIGLAKALQLAYQKAIEPLEADLILTDYYKINLPIAQISAVQGDNIFYLVSAASIIAKTYRDQLMRVYHTHSPNYGWRENVGYGTKEHLEAIEVYGTTDLHRKSFLKKEKRGRQ